MKLVFLIICLSIVLLTLETLIVRGFHSNSHRLLPLLLGLFALYDFYLIVEYLTGAVETFTILKELLLVNLLDVLLYYVLDFMRLKISIWHNTLIITLLISADILILSHLNNPDKYKIFLITFCVLSTIFIVALSIYAAKKAKYSKLTKENNEIMFLTLFIPALFLVFSLVGLLDETVYMPIAIGVSCIILDYLFYSDRLRDVDSIMKEEHFQTLEIPALLFDNDFFFLDASKKARELFGSYIEEIEKTPDEFELQNELRMLLKYGGIVQHVIGDKYYQCVLQEVNYHKRNVGYFLTFFDITEHKNETDIAKDIARQKSDFLASMSHDLRSPLHAIISSSEIVLSRVEMSERIRVMVNHIHEAGSKLLDIVNSILDFSKLEGGNLILHPARYNFRNLIEDQAQIAFVNLKRKPVTFSIEMADAYPEYLYGDELRVRQIIQNLISNAVKFTDSGSIRAKFNVSIENDKRVKITYEVSDTGIGMTSEQTKNVFSNYVTYAQEVKKEGTGLGLSIVKLLAEVMGGTAWAESDGKTGSTVTAYFYQDLIKEDLDNIDENGINLQNPLVILEEKQLGRDDNSWKNVNQPTYTYPRAKVLIADDMEVNLKIFKELTNPWKIQLDTAKDGREAVELVKQNKYDLIFLDQMMPVMTGTEAADEIINISDAPLILLTADITERMQRESVEHGFMAFMRKPIDLALLKQHLENFLPTEYREDYNSDSTYQLSNDKLPDESYKKALAMYISEVRGLQKVLPDYLENDMDMFRNKVHGIKGVSRQLGKDNIALLAEIMEMAAIADNKPFLDKYLSAFMDDIDFVITSSEAELMDFDADSDDNEGTNDTEVMLVEADASELANLFNDLKEALDQYEMNDIEEILTTLSTIALDESIGEKYDRVVELYDDMEYEDALNVVEEIINEL